MIRDEDKELVLSSVTMRDIAGMYGYKVTRSGYIKCPFHPDDNPSMKVYDGNRGFNCFVCHKGGDIIRFVRLHDNLDFEPAVRLIASHFGIPISDGKDPLSESDRKRIAIQKEKRSAAEKERKATQERLRELSAELHRLKEEQAQFEPLGAVWSWLQKRIEKTEHEWDYLFNERRE